MIKQFLKSGKQAFDTIKKFKVSTANFKTVNYITLSNITNDVLLFIFLILI